MESVGNKEGIVKTESNQGQEIHSKVIRAGKRTYFFDVKSTRKNEYYLTITESKKRTNEGGKLSYEKHKIFLYKEDFEKFADSLNEVLDFIKTNQPATDLDGEDTFDASEEKVKDYTNVEFDDI